MHEISKIKSLIQFRFYFLMYPVLFYLHHNFITVTDHNLLCLHLTSSLRQRTQSPNSLAVSLYAQNASIICREKSVLLLSYYVTHYKHVNAFLNVNKLFKGFTIIVDAENVAFLLLNMLKSLETII
jgi:hypothetical protein